MRPGASSATARVVAGAIVLAGRDPSVRPRPSPGQAEWSERLLAADPAARGLLRCVRSGAGRRVLRIVERLLLPGIVEHYLCRKQWLEGVWTEARADGFTQLLALGPGYDSLTLRVAAADAAVRIVEVDHPSTQRARRGVVTSAGLTRPPRLLDADLSAAPPRAWLERAFGDALDRSANLFVLAEGLFMYLNRSTVEEVMRALAALPCPRVRAAFTFMEHPEGRAAFRPQSPLVDTWLRLRGEPFRWGLVEGASREWLARLGWQVLSYAARPGRCAGVGLGGESALVAQARRAPASPLA